MGVDGNVKVPALSMLRNMLPALAARLRGSCWLYGGRGSTRRLRTHRTRVVDPAGME